MVEDGSKSIEAEVDNGTLDMGVVLLPVNEGAFESFSFVHEHLNLLVHPTHRLAGGNQANLFELEGETFILFREDFALLDRIIKECVN